MLKPRSSWAWGRLKEGQGWGIWGRSDASVSFEAQSKSEAVVQLTVALRESNVPHPRWSQAPPCLGQGEAGSADFYWALKSGLWNLGWCETLKLAFGILDSVGLKAPLAVGIARQQCPSARYLGGPGAQDEDILVLGLMFSWFVYACPCLPT